MELAYEGFFEDFYLACCQIRILKAYIMKYLVLLCTLFISAQGWCASGGVRHSQQIIENESNSFLTWVLAAYAIVAVSCTLAAKRSLDKILKEIFLDMGQC